MDQDYQDVQFYLLDLDHLEDRVLHVQKLDQVDQVDLVDLLKKYMNIQSLIINEW
jgi:hypothetical protein